MQDPFVAVKGEVEVSLSNAVTLFQSWNRIYSTASSTTNEELVWTADELKTAIEGIEQDLEDLEETINILLFLSHVADQNPEHFSLSANELSSRRQFVTRTRETIRDMQATLANPPPKKKLPTSKAGKDRQALFDGSSSSSRSNMSASPYRDVQTDGQRFIDSESGQQAILMQEQDDQLDGISGTLVNMKEIAVTMNQEVDDQVVRCGVSRRSDVRPAQERDEEGRIYPQEGGRIQVPLRYRLPDYRTNYSADPGHYGMTYGSVNCGL
ncbi:t-SNARE [Endogone sp. FLAS-F59071]|nr:t-SNARE [Endogone sp. FLAS-F59071]|eukprot:RUS20265.1 t-SNARE [Endogone sp. FLAS-F59071]